MSSGFTLRALLRGCISTGNAGSLTAALQPSIDCQWIISRSVFCECFLVKMVGKEGFEPINQGPDHSRPLPRIPIE